MPMRIVQVQNSVVKAAGTSLPKFDPVRDKPVTAPVRGSRDITVGILFQQFEYRRSSSSRSLSFRFERTQRHRPGFLMAAKQNTCPTVPGYFLYPPFDIA